jgi:hypothetical protein
LSSLAEELHGAHADPVALCSTRSEVGTALARIVLAEEVEPPVRQTAGVILKKFMDKWWDVLGEGLSEEVRPASLPAASSLIREPGAES